MSDREAIMEVRYLIYSKGYCKKREDLKSEIHKEYIKNINEIKESDGE